MVTKLYQSLTLARKKRVKIYGTLALLSLLTYLSLFILAITNQTFPSLNYLLAIFAGIGVILSIFLSITLFTLFVGEKDTGERSNGFYLLLACFSFFIPIFPLLFLTYSGYRKNNSLFRIIAGVVTFLHSLLFNVLILSLFDQDVTEDAYLLPVYLMGFINLLLILARFIKYLPVTTLEKIYKFLNIKS
jgi:hypothetical protein